MGTINVLFKYKFSFTCCQTEYVIDYCILCIELIECVRRF